MPQSADLIVIGGGIVGLATADAVLKRFPGTRLILLEAEKELAAHQTGHNSGVIHSGLYYKPGSLKAKNCSEGRERLYRFCEEESIPHERCGKLVIATEERELPALDRLVERGLANGLQGLEILSTSELQQFEPHAAGIAGIHVRETGIVDYVAVSKRLGERIEQAGGRILRDHRVKAIHPGQELKVSAGNDEFHARHLVACCGLQSDRVARMCGLNPGVQIVPFRGEYFELVPERRHLVRNLIYPVPDPNLPFLGVHLTRMIGGGIEAGPNAVLSFKREGYGKLSFSLADTASLIGYGGFWRMARQFWRTGIGEQWRSLNKRLFVRDLRRLVPEMTGRDIVPAGAGVRAQAVWPDGRLLDDFHILKEERMTHVLNAPSPAATACLSIGDSIAEAVAATFSPGE